MAPTPPISEHAYASRATVDAQLGSASATAYADTLAICDENADMLAKIILVLLILAMLVMLFRGLFTLAKDTPESKRTLRSLTVRVSIAVALIAFLIVAIMMGWIQPHGIGG